MKTLIEHFAFGIACDDSDRVIEDASHIVDDGGIGGKLTAEAYA